ncbi:hypothetical protein D9V82_11235 [Corynebacterium macginleyi]|nr:hypothetical protein D9V82_11235 [Corynebacterium macginleyi]
MSGVESLFPPRGLVSSFVARRGRRGLKALLGRQGLRGLKGLMVRLVLKVRPVRKVMLGSLGLGVRDGSLVLVCRQRCLIPSQVIRILILLLARYTSWV